MTSPRTLTPQEIDHRIAIVAAALRSAPETCPVNRAFVETLEQAGHLGAGNRHRKASA